LLTLPPEQVRQALAHHPCRRLECGTLRPAAVLLLFYRAAQGETVLFTRRADHLSHHAGEISFPGGRSQDSDGDRLATALRETEEEMGIVPGDVTVLGRLDDFISVYGYHVAPFVGTIAASYPYRVNRCEIAEVIELPVARLADPAIYHTENWEHGGRRFPVCFFNIEEHQVWGLTGAILRQFLQRIGIWTAGRSKEARP
jgi:8-oxo-dGTP pyrophosphatase MutT (NUDIX family)